MYSIVIYDHEDDYHKPFAFSHDVAFCDNLDRGPKSDILHRYEGRPDGRVTHWRHLAEAAQGTGNAALMYMLKTLITGSTYVSL